MAFFSIMLLAALQILAVMFSLYMFYWWFDIPMHFLGGFFVGILSLWSFFFAINYHGSPVTPLKVLVVGVLGALLVGLVWELFEYESGLTWNAIGSYQLDTIKDLTMDVLGGYTAYVYFVLKGYQKNI